MIALGIESGRKRQHMSGAKLHAETAGFAALDDDCNMTFRHEIPQDRSNVRSKMSNAGCDYALERGQMV
jgi:hypothetical protein